MPKDPGEAIVIKDLTGKILSAVVITGILSGIGIAFAQQATNAETRTNIENIQENNQERDRRLDKMDGKIDAVASNVNSVREQQARMDTKIDQLLRNSNISPSR